MKKKVQDEINKKDTQQQYSTKQLQNPRKSRTNKELFKISKFFYREIFLDGILASEGRLSEQYLQLIRRKGTKVTKNAATGFKGCAGNLILIAIIPIFMSLGPLYNNFQYIEDVNMFNNLLFSFTVTVNICFILLSIAVIYFGVQSLVGIFHKGSSYRLLETLPLNLKEKKKIILFAFYRTINAQIIVLFLALPIFTLLTMIIPLASGPNGGSIISIVAALIVSFSNMIFIISLTIFMSYFIANKVFKIENRSKKNTFLKIFFTISYILAPLSFGLVFSFVEKLFEQNYGSGNSFFFINSILSFIPFPFSGSLIYGISLFPLNKIYLNQVWPIFFGFAFSFVMVILFFRKSLNLLVSVIEGIDVNVKKNSKIEKSPIFITIRTPLKAIFKKDYIFITRDFSLMTSVFMPIASVIIGFLTLGNLGFIGANSVLSNVINIFFFTQGISFLIFGLTSAENISRELTLMLPIKQHDIYKEKRLIMWLMLLLAQFIKFIVQLIQNSNLLFLDYTLIFPILLNFCYEAVMIVFFSDYVLTLYALFFGKIWNKYSIQMRNSNKKALKGIIIVLSIFVLKIILSFFDIYLRIGIATLFSILMRVVAHKIFSKK